MPTAKKTPTKKAATKKAPTKSKVKYPEATNKLTIAADAAAAGAD